MKLAAEEERGSGTYPVLESRRSTVNRSSKEGAWPKERRLQMASSTRFAPDLREGTILRKTKKKAKLGRWGGCQRNVAGSTELELLEAEQKQHCSALLGQV